jgi:hypothetical protein
VYATLQIIASLGFEFTKGLSLGDNGAKPSQRGCTTDGCFICLACFGLLLFLAICNQFKFKEIPRAEVPEDAKCCRRLVLRVHITGLRIRPGGQEGFFFYPLGGLARPP